MTISERKSGLSLFAKQAIKYYIVGSFGILLSLGLLYSLTEFFGTWYILSYGIAIAVSITSNFILNKTWTFGDSIKSQRHSLMYLKYVFVSLVGMAFQLGLAFMLVESWEIYYMLAAFISIGIVSLANFVINRRWTFGVRS